MKKKKKKKEVEVVNVGSALPAPTKKDQDSNATFRWWMPLSAGWGVLCSHAGHGRGTGPARALWSSHCCPISPDGPSSPPRTAARPSLHPLLPSAAAFPAGTCPSEVFSCLGKKEKRGGGE